MNLIDMILTYKNKDRGVIRDESEVKAGPDRDNTFMAAREVASDLGRELDIVNKVNELLSAPIIEPNKNKHLTLTMPVRWLNDRPLRIVFSLETGTPLSAYFIDEDEE